MIVPVLGEDAFIRAANIALGREGVKVNYKPLPSVSDDKKLEQLELNLKETYLNVKTRLLGEHANENVHKAIEKLKKQVVENLERGSKE